MVLSHILVFQFASVYFAVKFYGGKRKEGMRGVLDIIVGLNRPSTALAYGDLT